MENLGIVKVGLARKIGHRKSRVIAKLIIICCM